MSTPCRRGTFKNIDLVKVQNPGLAFYRFLRSQEEGEKKDVPELLDAIAGPKDLAPYRDAYRRRRESLASLGARVVLGTCETPLAVGLGHDSPLEVGLAFQHAYGMPVIPGSAVKGLVRRAVRRAAPPPEILDLLFGKPEQAGAAVFFDAWYDPDTAGHRPFHRDVVTVHHPRYYQSRGETPATDMDDPTPVPFLVVKPRTRFSFALIAPPDTAGFLVGALKWALRELGVGAKTNAGYGRIDLDLQTATGAPPAGASAQAASGTVWKRVEVVYKPGQRELIASSSAQERAIANLDKIRAQIDPDRLAELEGKAKKTVADVLVEPAGGKKFHILAVRNPTAT
ncbi:MAG: type III-B CRISPR module RAMP protein Cmr6 [Fimbriimonadaceae bacterium]